MPNAFAPRNVKYWYEKTIYTAGPMTLPSGYTTLVSVSRWNTPNNPVYQAAIEMIQASQSPQVMLTWTRDPNNAKNTVNQGSLGAARAGLLPMRTYIPAVDTLSLQLQNTGSAVSNFQLNYAVSMRRLSILDKLACQRAGYTSPGNWYNLTPEDQKVLQALDLMSNGKVDKTGLEQMKALVDKGTGPLSLERVLQGVWKNRNLAAPADLFAVQVTNADTVFATYNASLDPTNPTRGSFLVLTEIALEGAPGIILTVDRDGQSGLMQLSGQAFAQADASPWEVFVPAINNLTFHATLAPGAVNQTAYIRLRVEQIQMSEVLAVQLGLAQHPSDVTGNLYYKVLAGVV